MSAQAWTLAPNNRWAAVASVATDVTFDLERGLVCVITPTAVSDGPQSIGGEVGARRGAQPVRAAKPSAAARPAAASKGAST